MRDLSVGHDSHLLASYLFDPFSFDILSVTGRSQRANSKVTASRNAAVD